MATLKDTTKLRFTRALDTCMMATPESDTELRTAIRNVKTEWAKDTLTFAKLAVLVASATQRQRTDILETITAQGFRSVRRRA